MKPIPEQIAFAAGQADAGRGDVHEAEGGGIDPGSLGHGRDVKPIEPHGCRCLQLRRTASKAWLKRRVRRSARAISVWPAKRAAGVITTSGKLGTRNRSHPARQGGRAYPAVPRGHGPRADPRRDPAPPRSGRCLRHRQRKPFPRGTFPIRMPLHPSREAGGAGARIETCSPDRVVCTTHLAWPDTEPKSVGDALDPDGPVGKAPGVSGI